VGDLEFTANVGLWDTLGKQVGGAHAARFHAGEVTPWSGIGPCFRRVCSGRGRGGGGHAPIIPLHGSLALYYANLFKWVGNEHGPPPSSDLGATSATPLQRHDESPDYDDSYFLTEDDFESESEMIARLERVFAS
jgi:hypothetical protein